MGTVRASLSISSSDVMTTDINLSVGAGLSADSGILSRAKVKFTGTNANALEVYTVNDKSESAYLYLKNLDTEKELTKIEDTVAYLENDEPFKRCFEDEAESYYGKPSGNRKQGVE